jgi:iron complex outermembrane receptor protein
VKRTSDSVVEAMSAEDLGKLPDVSIADALSRLPGLTSQRVDGRAEVISIRGLAPKYAVTLLNGRELVSTGDNRSVEFDQFPAELINAVTVYKTPDAALGAQGLSGTVNLQTLKPLDSKGRQINFNARAERNSNGQLVPGGASDKGGRISFSYVDKFADDTIGLAFGFAHLDSPGQEKYSKSWWWGNSAIWWGGFRGLENADPSKAPSTNQGFEVGATSTTHVRDGAMAVLEFKPNTSYHGELDLYYSKFDQTAQGRELQSSLMPDWSGDGTAGAPVSGGPIFSNVGLTQSGQMQYATSGTIGNVDPYVVSRYDRRKDKIVSVGFNNEFFVGDWTATADLSYSNAKRDEVVAEFYGSATSLTGFGSFNSPLGNGFDQYTPALDFSSPANVQLRGISNWGNLQTGPTSGLAQAGSLSPISVDDTMKAVRLSAKRSIDWGIFSNFDGGVNLTHREKNYALTQDIYALANGSPCTGQSTNVTDPLGNNYTVQDNCAQIPGSMIGAPVRLGFAGVPQLINFSVQDALNSGAYISAPSNISSSPGRIWGITEKVSTAYGKVGLRFNAGVPVHGNIGLQIVHANQTSTGVSWDAGDPMHGIPSAVVPMSMGKSYTDVLPSLNLVFDVATDTYLRASLAKVLARPNLDDMRAGFTASVATSGQLAGHWSGSGGNPLLDPWRATQLDLSLEHYIGKRSYWSIAAFKKKLKSSIYVADTSFDFTGFPNAAGTPVLGNNIGILSAPVNGQGGYVQGLELAISYELGRLLRPLDGFGFQASVSKTGSSVPGPKLDGSGKPDLQRPLEGLSGTVSSAILYYEKNGFEARLAQRYRSDFVAGVRGVWITNSVAAIRAERITDAQVSYSWTEGSMKGLSIMVEANNLADTPYRTSSNDDSYTSIYGGYHMVPERYQTYGKWYLVGFNYKL